MGKYSITVLEVGYGENVPQEFYLGDFSDGTTTYPVHPFSMTLVRGEGRNILIDCGIDIDNPDKAAVCQMCGIGHMHSPREVLGTVGLTPEDIDAVILTHAHFDHAGGIDCFPTSHFYLQRREMEGWCEYVTNDAHAAVGMFSMDKEDVKRLRKLENEGRLTLLDGDVTELFPGISVKAAAFGHTFGMQMVLIETDEGLFIHVGDVANRPENLLGTEAFPFFIPNVKFGAGAPYYTIIDYERIMKWTLGRIDPVIMTHDGSRREKFPGCVGPLGLGIYKYC